MAGCASVGTVRPPFLPFYEAYVDTLPADPSDLLRALEVGVASEGFAIRVASAFDGYLETRWLRLAGGRADGDAGRERVLLRFWIDALGPLGYQLTAEAVRRRTSDPSLPPREAEAMVPPGHQGERALVRILNSVKEQFEG